MAVVLSLVVMSSCGQRPEDQPSLTLFCGAANKPAMEEIAALYEMEKGVDVDLLFGGSGTMLSQIELSKRGDLYIPGSPDFVTIAKRKKLIIEDSERIVAYLVPAIITPSGNPARISCLEDLARPGVKVAIGNPETVCLGLYGVELFAANNLLDDVLKNVVTFGASCAKLAHLPAMGHVDAIIGWRVSHYWNPERMDLVLIAKEKLPRLSYIPVTIPVFAKSREQSEAFIDFLLSERCRAIYEKHGYITDLEEARQYAPKAELGGEFTLPDNFLERVESIWQK